MTKTCTSTHKTSSSDVGVVQVLPDHLNRDNFDITQLSQVNAIEVPARLGVPSHLFGPSGQQTHATSHIPTQYDSSEETPVHNMVIHGVGERAHQPTTIKFQKRHFGQKKPVQRSFQASWFRIWPWLHYVEDEDKVLCHICTRAFKLNQLSSTRLDTSFITKGYTNWKDATAKKSGFSQHETSDCHREAVARLITLPATTKDVGESLSLEHEECKAENR